jgi:hypothetical protein
MTPDDLERFEICLKDLDVFIGGFQKQAAGPNGEHYKEPLQRLKSIRGNVSFLRKSVTAQGEGNGPGPGADLSRLASKLNNTVQQNFKTLRSDLSTLAAMTVRMKPNVKRIEGASSQILSLGQVSVEVAKKLRGLLKESNAAGKAGANSEVIEEVKDALKKLELKVNALGRGIAKVNTDVSELPDLLDEQADNIEVNFAAIESKVSGLLERADMGGVVGKLEPRLRNSEDGLKLVLDQQKQFAELLGAIQPGEDKGEQLAILERILDRQSAIESLSMVLHPLSQSYQELSNNLKDSQESTLAADLGKQFDELRERVGQTEDLLEKIFDRQGAIEALSMVLQPLSLSYQVLVNRFDEVEAVTTKIDSLTEQVTALQAMLRNSSAKADLSSAKQPAMGLSEQDTKTLDSSEKPAALSLEESDEGPQKHPEETAAVGTTGDVKVESLSEADNDKDKQMTEK